MIGSKINPIELSDDNEEEEKEEKEKEKEEPPKKTVKKEETQQQQFPKQTSAVNSEQKQSHQQSSLQSPTHPQQLSFGEMVGILIAIGDSEGQEAVRLALNAKETQITIEEICNQHYQMSVLACYLIGSLLSAPVSRVLELKFKKQQQENITINTISEDIVSLMSDLPQDLSNQIQDYQSLIQVRDQLTSKLELLTRSNNNSTTPTSMAPSLPLSSPPIRNHHVIVKISPQRNCITSQKQQPQQFPLSQRRQFLILEDASSGICSIPIPVFNEIDQIPFDTKFTWIKENTFGLRLESKPEEFIAGCQCDNCNNTNCSCAKESHGLIFPYDDKGRVLLEPRSCIYECNSKCICALLNENCCKNRVIQRGSVYKIEIFRTQHKGWGVRAGEDIPAHVFICEYLGEVIDQEAAESRGKLQDSFGCSYLFDLDLEKEKANVCPVVDANNYGSVSRFLNHSCDPNLDKYFFWVEHLDKRFPRVAFFSARDIKKGEELTFDYCYTKRRGKKGNSIKCHCGAPNCRKDLY